MPTASELLEALDSCPDGLPAWRQFEGIATQILSFLFVPTLAEPRLQARSFSGIDRRDAIFGNRNMTLDTVWGQLRQEVSARMVLVEFKNYDRQEIGKNEVDQTRNYLTQTIGRFALICCRKEPTQQAYLRRNQVYTQEQKVILFLTDEHLREMIRMKERGDDPALFIMDLLELFYIQHE